jgi:hypothetical protein
LKRTFQKKPPPSSLTPSHTRQASYVNPDDADDQRRPEQMFDGQRQGEEPGVSAAA